MQQCFARAEQGCRACKQLIGYQTGPCVCALAVQMLPSNPSITCQKNVDGRQQCVCVCVKEHEFLHSTKAVCATECMPRGVRDVVVLVD
jgi:hypothetical protein